MLDNETGGWNVGEVGTVKDEAKGRDPDRENRRDVRKANFMVTVCVEKRRAEEKDERS